MVRGRNVADGAELAGTVRQDVAGQAVQWPGAEKPDGIERRRKMERPLRQELVVHGSAHSRGVDRIAENGPAVGPQPLKKLEKIVRRKVAMDRLDRTVRTLAAGIDQRLHHGN